MLYFLENWSKILNFQIKIVLYWNGKNIDKWFDYETDEWNLIIHKFTYKK
ncbi:MAG: hypothetical protein ACRENO_10695 [Thermodesulfobacteriota bacterium]